MNLSLFALKYYRLVLLSVASLMVVGLVSFFTLPAKEDPTITIREAVITTQYPGLPADRVELLITKRIEEAIRQVPELEEIRSVSMQGVSIIHAEVFDRYFDLDQIWDEVRHKVDGVSGELPEGTLTPSINDDFGDVAVLTLALSGDAGFTMGQLFDQAQHIRDLLYSVDGTKRVDLLGAQEERIYIQASNARLAHLGLAPDALITALQQRNIIRPGGTIDVQGQSFIIEPTGNFASEQAIEDTLLSIPDSEESVRLGDIAQIRRGLIDPPYQTAYFNGKPAIMFAIAMNEHYNILDYSPRLEAVIEQQRQLLPAGMTLDIATRQADQVANAVYGVSANVLETLAVVIAVVVMFLGLRTGLVVGAIVPAVMLLTLSIMKFTDIDLQRMSLATLVISLGLLVDNGIVIAEDFKRRLEEGEARLDALRNTGQTLALPLLSSSLTTILVFLPFMLAEHVAGEYTRSISEVILIALLVSWVIALTVTPLLCYRFVRLPPKNQEGMEQRINRLFDRANPAYLYVLTRILARPKRFLASMLLLLVGAIVVVAHTPQKFFPDSDRSQVLVNIDLPAGSSMRETDRQLQQVLQAFEDRERFPYVESHAAYGGFGGPRFVLSLNPIDPEDSKAFAVLNIDALEHSEATISAVRALFAEQFPNLNVRPSKMFLGPSDSSKVEIQIKGPDADYLYATAAKIRTLLESISGVIDIRNDWENRITQIKVNVDQQRALRAGVTSTDVALSLQRYFSGEAISELREGDDLIPIEIRASDQERFDLSRIYDVNIYASGGDSPVPLMQIADVTLENNYARIARENLFRTITIEARNSQITAESMVPLLQAGLDEIRAELPPSHTLEYDGVVADSAEAQGALQGNMPLCLGVIALLLLAQFNSLRRTLIVLLTIPLMMIGAAAGLFFMQANFGFMVMLGLYALAGIIVNNAIVLIDRIDIERSEGAPVMDAVKSASVRRLRPIVITSVTTILGLLPLILTRDPLFFGMASVIAFGLAVGTVLTLGVTPVLYSLLLARRA